MTRAEKLILENQIAILTALNSLVWHNSLHDKALLTSGAISKTHVALHEAKVWKDE